MTDNTTTRLMLKLEQGLHKQGWDRSPGLFVIQNNNGQLRLIEQSVPWNGAPGAIMENIAEQMDEPNQWGELMTLAMAILPGFYGLMFSHEAWSNTIAPADRDNRRLADIPGSKEMRGVFSLLVTGKAYYVMRIRGEKPRIDEFEQIAGRVPVAMLKMVRAIARLLPEGAADHEALVRMPILDEEDIEKALRRPT